MPDSGELARDPSAPSPWRAVKLFCQRTFQGLVDIWRRQFAGQACVYDGSARQFSARHRFCLQICRR
jgi:hypothetical protein